MPRLDNDKKVNLYDARQCIDKAKICHKDAEKAAKKRKKVFAIGASIVCACMVFVITFTTVIIPKQRLEDEMDLLSKANVGDSVFFGTYEQDNHITNGKEKIEWTVFNKEGGSLLLISKYALDCHEYNDSYTDVTWETCSLRKWLNSSFIRKAFSGYEKARIYPVTEDENAEYSPDSGNAAQDRVFLLNITEVDKYFSSDTTCEATDYAIAQGADKYGSWWLRSSGRASAFAAYVDSHGSTHDSGCTITGINVAVRPALWINLE